MAQLDAKSESDADDTALALTDIYPEICSSLVVYHLFFGWQRAGYRDYLCVSPTV